MATTQPAPFAFGQILAARHNERRSYTPAPPTHVPQGRVYAVMLLQTPAYPDGTDLTNVALIVAEEQAGRWTWIHQTPETREVIGSELDAAGAQRGDWWYLEIS